jgi:hypothetical protein
VERQVPGQHARLLAQHPGRHRRVRHPVRRLGAWWQTQKDRSAEKTGVAANVQDRAIYCTILTHRAQFALEAVDVRDLEHHHDYADETLMHFGTFGAMVPVMRSNAMCS